MPSTTFFRRYLSLTALSLGASVLLGACGGGGDSVSATPEPPAAPSWSPWAVRPLPSAWADPTRMAHGLAGSDGRGGLILFTSRAVAGTATPTYDFEAWRLGADDTWSGPTVLGRLLNYETPEAASLSGNVLTLRFGDQLRRWNVQAETWDSIAPPPPAIPGASRYRYSTMADGRLLAATIRGTPTTTSSVELFVLSNLQWVALKSLPVPADTGPERFTDPSPLIWNSAIAYESAAGTLVRVDWGVAADPPFQSLPKYSAEFIATGSPVTTQNFGVSCFAQSSFCDAKGRVLRNGDIAYWRDSARFPAIGWVARGGQFATTTLTNFANRFWSDYTAFANTDEGDLFVLGSCDWHFAFCEGNTGVRWINPATLAARDSAGGFPQSITANGSMILLQGPSGGNGSTQGEWMISSRVRRAEYTEPERLPLNVSDLALFVVESGANDQFVVAADMPAGGRKVLARKRR